MTRLLFGFFLGVVFAAGHGIAHADNRMRGMTISPLVTTDDINDLAAFKVNVVRYQLFWLGPVNTANETEYNVWLDSALAKLDGELATFEANNIKVILDLHTPPGGLSIVTTPHKYRLFAEQWAQDAFIRAWEKIAAKYVGNTVIIGYDILNEPAQPSVSAGLKDWNALALATCQAIRAIDPDHKIIIEPIYGDQARLGALKVIKLPNIVYSPHLYYPKKFREQGFNGKPINVKYPKGKFNARGIRDALARARRFQTKHRVKIYLGEFAAVRWAPGKSGANFLRDSIRLFEKYKWDWTYHAWREDDAWSVEHGSDPANHDPVAEETDRAKVLKKFFEKNG